MIQLCVCVCVCACVCLCVCVRVAVVVVFKETFVARLLGIANELPGSLFLGQSPRIPMQTIGTAATARSLVKNG